MHTNAYVSTLDTDTYRELKCVSHQLEVRENDDCKLQNSSPMSDRAGVSILYNDSGYITNVHPDPTSFSSNSNSNSEPSFETSEEISLHSRPANVPNNLYFCEDAVFDEPKLVGPPLLCDNTNNYEEFSSLIKFSLEDTSSNYLNNDINLHSAALPICDFTDMQDDIASCISNMNNKLLNQFEDNLCSLTSAHIRQSQNSVASDYSNSSIISIQKNLELNESSSSLKTINNTTSLIPVETNFINSEVSTQIECNITNSTINDDEIVNNETCHTPLNSYKNLTSDMSPELFSETEDEPIETTSSFCAENITQSSALPKSCSQLHPEYENTLRNDRKLLKRVQETLSGVPPPPSVTILQMSVNEMLEKLNSNKQFFFDQPDGENPSTKSLLINTNKEKTLKTDWKEVLQLRFHGLQ